MYVSVALTWHDAKEYCQNINGRLAEPRTLKEYLFIRYITESFGTGLWLGGSDIDTEGRYVWLSDSQPVENQFFRVWAAGEPNNPTEDCLDFHNLPGVIGFNDRWCSFIQRFVCEVLHDAYDSRCL